MFDSPSKPKSILEKCAADENWRELSRRPGHAGLAACGILAVAVAAAAWYAFPALKRHDSLLAQSAGMKRSLETLGGRLDQQTAKLGESSNSLDDLRQQIADLRREMRSRVATARKQAGQSANDLVQSLEKELGGQIDGIKAKVARLELSRDADQVQIADLQNEVVQLRSELAAQNQQLTNRIAESTSGTERYIAAVQASEEHDRSQVEDLSRKLAVRRIDFEVSKGRNVELTPGISFEISGTDVAYRRASGWIWVVADRRTIWLREQGAQEPVIFYGNDDGRKRELVITSVTPHAAVGYLLIPDDREKPETAAVRADASASE
jgi:septal ring factor EnvC (AmiA/AmiB activator)